MHRYIIAIIVVSALGIGSVLGSSGKYGKGVERPDFETYFKQFGVVGACVVYNSTEDTYVWYNPERCRQRSIPASTFKIPNSLIALETGVIADENTVIAWDSTVRSVPVWNADTDLRHAFANSTVWYYQELARRIGEKRMSEYVEKFQYGNMDISGGIDRFWLTGGLCISPEEQLQFLRRLYNGELPVSRRTADIVKNIAIREQTAEYTLSGKTGWATINSIDIGWFVGCVERDGNTWFYATTIECAEGNKRFAQARIDITKAVLQELQVLP